MDSMRVRSESSRARDAALFESIDRAALRALPAEPYVFAQWKKVRVHVDYHVELERHYYSVPHTLVGRQLDARYTERTVECLPPRATRCQPPARSSSGPTYHRVRRHMPEKHRRMGRWTPERFIALGRKSVGRNTGALITTVLGSRRHPQQAFRSCLGILRLAKSYGDARLEAAARRALAIGANSYRSIESILNHRLDEHPPEPIEPTAPIEHHNIRGSDYYS